MIWEISYYGLKSHQFLESFILSEMCILLRLFLTLPQSHYQVNHNKAMYNGLRFLTKFSLDIFWSKIWVN